MRSIRLRDICLNCKEVGIENDRFELKNGKIICVVCAEKVGEFSIDRGKLGEKPEERIHLRQGEIYGHDKKRQ